MSNIVICGVLTMLLAAVLFWLSWERGRTFAPIMFLAEFGAVVKGLTGRE